MKITKILAQQILDSRGNPTIEVTVIAGINSGKFAVPAGMSTGSFEANEKRDRDLNKFRGLGVQSAINLIEEEIYDALKGIEIEDQTKIDQTLISLDGTENKSRLGGNSLIGVSIACCKAAASSKNLEVFEYLKTLANINSSRKTPYLYMNLINGGKHAQSNLAFQEYHVVPQTDEIEEALNIGTAILYETKKVILKNLGFSSANLGDEGGFVPDLKEIAKPFDYLLEAISNLKLEGKVKLALDAAASSFYSSGSYKLNDQTLTSDQMLSFYNDLLDKYNLLSIEDPFFENDFDNFTKLTSLSTTLVVGDDLTATNQKRLQQAIDKKSLKAIIIKPNQIGTLSETLKAMELARENGLECIVSHRSGETNDDFIADLAYAFGCFGLKAGAPQRGERVAKYNRLMKIAKL